MGISNITKIIKLLQQKEFLYARVSVQYNTYTHKKPTTVHVYKIISLYKKIKQNLTKRKTAA